MVGQRLYKEEKGGKESVKMKKKTGRERGILTKKKGI